MGSRKTRPEKRTPKPPMSDSSSTSDSPQKACKFDSQKLILKLSVTLCADRKAVDPVVHGAHSDPTKIIECDVACDETHGVLIVVRDPGPGFDVSKLPDPCAGDNIFASHGRGIYLINQLMDEVQFHKNGTEIHM